MLYNLVDMGQGFEGTYCHHHQVERFFFTEMERAGFSQPLVNIYQNYTALRPR
jgi:hypothetical protein